MSKAVLYYFPVKSVGEAIRLLLTYGDVEFEDRRIPDEEWPKFKASMPFRQMPVLEMDGKRLAQSLSISRYLGRKFGLGGKTIEEDYEIDQTIDFLIDIRAKGESSYWETDVPVKEKKREEMIKDYPEAFKKLDEIIRKNNGHVALGRLTWGDFVFAGVFDYFKEVLATPDLEKQYPSFQQVVDAVYTIPKIKAFSEKAPKCDW